MKAAVLEQIPGELVVDDVQIGAVGPREVLVRTVAAGLCHSDLHFMEGKYPCPVPAVLGHESAGIVEAVGDHVTYVQPGDHVDLVRQRLLRRVRVLPVRSAVPLRQGRAGARRRGPPRLHARRQAGLPVLRPVELRRAAARARELAREDPPRHAARQGGAHRLRRDDRRRRGDQHGKGPARRDGRGDRLRRHRPQRGPGRGDRRRGPRHRRRPHRVEARAGRTVRRDRRRRRVRRSIPSGGASSSPAAASTTRSRRSGSRRRPSRRSTCCARAAPRP